MSKHLLIMLLWCLTGSTTAAEFVEPSLGSEVQHLSDGALVMGRITPADDRTLELHGQLVQGGVLFGVTRPGAKVQHDEQPVPVSAQGDFVIGFERMAPVDSVLRLTLPDGSLIERDLKIAQRKYDIERIDGLPQDKVTPDPAVKQRIADDQAAVKGARALLDDRTDYVRGFQWPVTGRISGVYGSQRILNGEPRWPHYGIDIARPEGTPVMAPADAIVTLAHPDMFYSGATLIMDHGQGFSSTFLHLQKIMVTPGQRIKQGEVVGLMGATGRVTGPHLDWRMNLRGKRVDPATLVGEMPKGQHVRERGI